MGVTALTRVMFDHHHQNHHQDHGPKDYNRAFVVGISLNVGFVLVEAVFGLLAGSLALLADAGHNLSDVLSLLLAWGASFLAGRKPTARRTYGFRRATVLAALLSAVLLLMALGVIAWEAVGRFGHPVAVEEITVIVVAGIGVVINTLSALLFMSGRDRDLNIRGAYLHLAADAAISLGVVIAGVVILLTGWMWLDPVISLLIVALILVGTWGLFRDSMNLAMDAVPDHIDAEAVSGFLSIQPGVTEVHDLHIWGMSTTEAALTAHLVMPDPNIDDRFLHNLSDALRHRFGIDHTTIQIERGDTEYPCNQASPDNV